MKKKMKNKMMKKMKKKMKKKKMKNMTRNMTRMSLDPDPLLTRPTRLRRSQGTHGTHVRNEEPPQVHLWDGAWNGTPVHSVVHTRRNKVHTQRSRPRKSSRHSVTCADPLRYSQKTVI